MATYEELMAAARKADAAGEAADAKRLLEMAAELKGSFGPEPTGGVSVNKEAADDLKNRLTTLTANTANAMSFGFGDEALGAKAGVESLLSGGKYLPAYRAERDKMRGDMATINEKFPAMATTGNLVGAAIPAITASPLGAGKSMLDTGLRGLGIGAVEGGLQGAGNADGRDAVWETIKGATIGGGVGLAAPALVGVAGAVKNAVKDPLTGALSFLPGLSRLGAKGKANRAIAEALARSGKTAPDLDALIAAAKAAGQPEFRLVDALGLSGQRMASGIVRAGSTPGDEVAEFLATRQSGQPERVTSFVEDAFGVGGTTADKTKDGLIAARKAEADTAYDAARGNAAPVDVRSALGVIDARTGGMTGSGVAGDGIDSKLLGYRARLAAQPGPDGVMRELSDFDRVLGVKQSIQDDIGAAVRAGRNNEARELGKLVQELDAALEASSDMYRAANDGFRSASKVIDAVDEGAMMATRGRAADNVPRFQSMPPPQQGAARVGYGDKLIDQLDRITSPTSNRAKPLQSPKRATEAEAMATDYPLYSGRLARENTMWETQNRALGGSRTADNLADQDAISGLAGGAAGAAKSAANFQFGDAVAKIAAVIGPVARGKNEATRRLIAQALLSSDPMKVMAPVLAQASKSSTVRRLIEAMIRQPMRENAEASVQ